MSKPKISQFRPQLKNANGHTQRGMGMLDRSISKGGWIGAITTAADNEVFDGSARLEVVYERFGEDADPIVLDIDGTRPVVLRRIDIPTADHPQAKELAIAANRVAQVNLDWVEPELREAHEEIGLDDWFLPEEMKDWGVESEGDGDGDRPPGGGGKEIDCVCPNCGHEFIRQLGK